jgi:hypothetical protein
VIDVKFELNGELVVLILEKTGAYFYELSTLTLLAELSGHDK